MPRQIEEGKGDGMLSVQRLRIRAEYEKRDDRMLLRCSIGIAKTK